MPTESFSFEKRSLRPSFFTTYNSPRPIFSYVVNRFLHFKHFLLRLTPSGESLLLITLVSPSQNGQSILYTISCTLNIFRLLWIVQCRKLTNLRLFKEF